MKHFMGFSMLLGLGVLGFAGCSKGMHSGASDNSNQQAPVKEISISPMVQASVNDFSFNFLQHLEASAPKNENFFVSPLSLHMDLGMVLSGAAGNTYDELLKVLDLDGKSLDQVNKAYKTLLDQLPGADPKVKLGLYNSIWYKKAFPFKQDYLKSMQDNFEATVKALDFKPDDASYINDWASDKTNGKIKKVLDVIQPDDVMFLVNALYFKGDWSSKFDKDNTRAADFHLEDGSTKQVQMMHQSASFKHYSAADYTAIQLPYGNGQFSMTVILPKQGQTLNKVLAGLGSNDWANIQDNMVAGKINLGLPRFTIPTYEIKLNAVLEAMGMKAAFSSKTADFSKMSAQGVYVSFVKQDTYLKVDEQGTEAAAVTTTGMVTTSVQIPQEMLCDHPFGIIISEKTSNTILFMGKIMDPDSE
ncbi:serpin family protein [Arachidicoccus ginsenosidivorans]|uniref:Serpin family protein n=1 Tax=Arachidicoccus ginsenosidivorans TaxID=496057 RepID=A0A5B8VMA1_9BACT|nr:serpin family protein [Arachidicoccus ginsenosidivorans]QEC72459.1 serpin family protein [Arachidicoccus ginsenosidivorans]